MIVFFCLAVEGGLHVGRHKKVLVRAAFAVGRDGGSDVLAFRIVILDPKAIGIEILLGTQHAEGFGTAFFDFPRVAFAHKGEVLHGFLVSDAFRVGVLVERHAVKVSAGEDEFGAHGLGFFAAVDFGSGLGSGFFVVVLVAGAEGESGGGEQEHAKDFTNHRAENRDEWIEIANGRAR